MKLYLQNKHPNVSSNCLNCMQKTVRTFMGRSKEWFEFPVLFMFLNYSLLHVSLPELILQMLYIRINFSCQRNVRVTDGCGILLLTKRITCFKHLC